MLAQRSGRFEFLPEAWVAGCEGRQIGRDFWGKSFGEVTVFFWSCSFSCLDFQLRMVWGKWERNMVDISYWRKWELVLGIVNLEERETLGRAAQGATDVWGLFCTAAFLRAFMGNEPLWCGGGAGRTALFLVWLFCFVVF